MLIYVACGLSLTAHIALADHHCLDHCRTVPLSPDAPTTLTADGHCSFDHHLVEEHHEEAVNRNTSLQFVSLTATLPGLAADLVDLGSEIVSLPDTTSLRIAHGPPVPARAPPTSLPV